MSETSRYKLYRAMAHGSWWLAFTWTAVLTYANLTRDIAEGPSAFQRVSGLGIVLLIGVAIAMGNALSRMRITKTILSAFETGQRVAEIRLLAKVDEEGAVKLEAHNDDEESTR